MVDFMASRAALSDLVGALNIDCSEKLEHTVVAKITSSKAKASGNIDFKINCNWHSPDGPYLDFSDTIKGFKIFTTKFTARWHEITWDEDKLVLSVKHPEGDFEFSLRSIKLK